ncbi:MAG: T9SS type A sorting domain-containing protein [Bacteroidales bacterium]|nr:T9SS type A sorting domain-containing protein [Bacteroidales bacterium]
MPYPYIDHPFEGSFGIWYRTNETHHNALKRTFLIVSGFDPANTIRIAEGEVSTDNGDRDKNGKKLVYLYDIANKNGFLDDLRKQGYDIIGYRCVNSTESIINNGNELIGFIKNEIVAKMPSDAQMVVVGASMGGLLCRYALTKMEHDGDEHRTALFVSMDSPQEGANIPLGFQHMIVTLTDNMDDMLELGKIIDWRKKLDVIDRLMKKGVRDFSVAEKLAGVLEMLHTATDVQLGCDAAQEMLLYHHTATSGGVASPSPLRNNYLTQLESLGSFPRQCVSLAISMGSGTGVGQGAVSGGKLLWVNRTTLDPALFAVGNTLLGGYIGAVSTVLSAPALLSAYAALRTCLLSIGISFDDLDMGVLTMELGIKAMPSSGSATTVFSERIGVNVPIPYVVPTLWPPFFEIKNAPVYVGSVKDEDVTVRGVPIDNAPGSIKGMHNLTDFMEDEGKLSKIFNVMGILDIAYREESPDCFIPSYSALGLGNLSGIPHTPVAGYLRSTPAITPLNSWMYHNRSAAGPFEFMYIENANGSHIYNRDKSSALTAGMLSGLRSLLPLTLRNETGQKLLAAESTPLRLSVSGTVLPAAAGRTLLEVTATDPADPHGWKTFVPEVNHSSSLYLSYAQLAEQSGVPFGDRMGRWLKFRSVKQINGRPDAPLMNVMTDSVKFYPAGFSLSVGEIRRTACDGLLSFDLCTGKASDIRYMQLPLSSGGRYAWMLSDPAAGRQMECSVTPVSGKDRWFRFTPAQPDVFSQPDNRSWRLQLQETGVSQQNTDVYEVDIPRRPLPVAAAQMEAAYEINGVKYHLPDTLHKFAMLRIDNPDFVTHPRLPYQVLDADNPDADAIAVIREPGASVYEEMTPEQQEELNEEFETYFNTNYQNNRAARLAFAKTQQGLLLDESVSRIAMPKDESFFLYSKQIKTNVYRLYKATLDGKNIVATEALIPSENVIHFEVTPDGVWCVYQRYDEDGLYRLPLTGSIPPTGVKISNYAIRSTTIDHTSNNHIYRSYYGEWLFLSYYWNVGLVSVDITGEWAMSHDWNMFWTQSVSEDGIMYHIERESEEVPHPFAIRKTDMSEGISSSSTIGRIWPKCQWVSEITIYQNEMFSYSTCNLYTWPQLCSRDVTPSDIYSKFFPYPPTPTVKELYLHFGTPFNDRSYNDNYHYAKKATFVPDLDCHLLDIELLDVIDNDENRFAVVRTTQSYGNDHLMIVLPSEFYTIFESTNSKPTAKINPITGNVIFSDNIHTYLNSSSYIYISGKAASNICFSGDGRYFTYIDKISGHVYKYFADDEAAIEETAELYRFFHWKAWLSQRLGTKVSSGKIVLNQMRRWVLCDADGCLSEPFEVTVTAPATPQMSYTLNGTTATVTYLGGGAPPYYRQGTELKINQPFYIYGLHYGDNLITLTDAAFLPGQSFVIRVPGKGITSVSAAPQTTPTPNGSLTFVTQGISGAATYIAERADMPYTRYTATGKTIGGLPAGMYKVSIQQGNELFARESDVEVASQIFAVENIAVAHAATLNGKGGITVKLTHAAGDSKCYINNVSYPVASGTVTAGNLSAGRYVILAENKNYRLYDTVVIDRPDFRGTLKIRYTADQYRISTNDIYGNTLFDGYVFRMCHADGVAASFRQESIAVPAGKYTLEAYNAQTGDRATIYTLAQGSFAQYGLSVAAPVCPSDSGVIALVLKKMEPGFEVLLHTADTTMTYSGQTWTFRLPPSPMGKTEFRATLQRNGTEFRNGFTVVSSSEQFIDTSFLSPEQVFAQPYHSDITCAGADDGRIWLQHLRGGSGEWRYRINDGEWRHGGDTVPGLRAGRYAVSLQDAHYACPAVTLDSISVVAPLPLRLDSMIRFDPVCERPNGYVAAMVSGGSGSYSARRFRNDAPPDTVADALSYRSGVFLILGDTLTDGTYRVEVSDGNGCTLQGEAVLKEYRNPRITKVTVHEATGSIEAAATGGVMPVERLLLLSGDSIVRYETAATCRFDTLPAGQYTVQVRDAAGCLANEAHTVSIPEKDAGSEKEDPSAEEEDDSDDITVYPNPTDGKVRITRITGNETIFVYDVSGTFLFSTKGNEVDFSDLPSGMYLLRIGKSNRMIKVIKTN